MVRFAFFVLLPLFFVLILGFWGSRELGYPRRLLDRMACLAMWITGGRRGYGPNPVSHQKDLIPTARSHFVVLILVFRVVENWVTHVDFGIEWLGWQCGLQEVEAAMDLIPCET